VGEIGTASRKTDSVPTEKGEAKMIKIELNDMTADDVKCIEELRSLGYSDEYIQEIYDTVMRNRKAQDNKQE
jgi:DNA-binding transcriptional regulator YhcF (GntR family)